MSVAPNKLTAFQWISGAAPHCGGRPGLTMLALQLHSGADRKNRCGGWAAKTGSSRFLTAKAR